MFFRDPSPELTTENEALIKNQTKPFYKSLESHKILIFLHQTQKGKYIIKQ